MVVGGWSGFGADSAWSAPSWLPASFGCYRPWSCVAVYVPTFLGTSALSSRALPTVRPLSSRSRTLLLPSEPSLVVSALPSLASFRVLYGPRPPSFSAPAFLLFFFCCIVDFFWARFLRRCSTVHCGATVRLPCPPSPPFLLPPRRWSAQGFPSVGLALPRRGSALPWWGPLLAPVNLRSEALSVGGTIGSCSSRSISSVLQVGLSWSGSGPSLFPSLFGCSSLDCVVLHTGELLPSFSPYCVSLLFCRW